MTKDEFKNLDFQEKISYLNNRLKEGNTVVSDIVVLDKNTTPIQTKIL